MHEAINIIDLFAGPGGLGEGFSSLCDNSTGDRHYQIRMSVECEPAAHQTLTLRAFSRLVKEDHEKTAYRDYLEGIISKEELVTCAPETWQKASTETLHEPSELGKHNERIHNRVNELIKNSNDAPWIVIGGPPCQAYSLAGRSRNKGIKDYIPEKDNRHFLYREYLDVLAKVQPAAFVMENVKGILTSKINNQRIFPTIRQDLSNPRKALGRVRSRNDRLYRVYSFVVPASLGDESGEYSPEDRDFVIRAEQYGIPQARHRVILLGVATDLDASPTPLLETPTIPIETAIDGLPRLRSRLSRGNDSATNWQAAIRQDEQRIASQIRKLGNADAADMYLHAASAIDPSMPTQAYGYSGEVDPLEGTTLGKWLLTDRPPRLLNHETRGHIPGDLRRYLFCSSWAASNMNEATPSPKAHHFPAELAPNHANWQSGKFADRFRVQAAGRPATTITSHISKDGHYFIHHDPTQCRSLTVREAARIQTFPDNYLFEGNRTQQYVQVGNAVPPLLAKQLAQIVYKCLSSARL